MSAPTPAPWRVFETTVYSDALHTGVAACAPDPMCREHYRGGPDGGNFFAPPEDLGERLANARLIAAAPRMLAKLEELALECAECAGTALGRNKMVRCIACLDIWAVIEAASGKRP